MANRQRYILLGVALVVLVAGFVIAQSGGSSNSTVQSTGTAAPTATAGTTTPAGGGTKTATSTTIAAPPSAVVTVRNGKPLGGVKEFTFKKGETIDLTVHSDTADEVHFHGYDVHKDVTRGGTVRFRIPATIEGIFIVELEKAKQTLAKVKVEP
jgi:hypothetical protein